MAASAWRRRRVAVLLLCLALVLWLRHVGFGFSWRRREGRAAVPSLGPTPSTPVLRHSAHITSPEAAVEEKTSSSLQDRIRVFSPPLQGKGKNARNSSPSEERMQDKLLSSLFGADNLLLLLEMKERFVSSMREKQKGPILSTTQASKKSLVVSSQNVENLSPVPEGQKTVPPPQHTRTSHQSSPLSPNASAQSAQRRAITQSLFVDPPTLGCGTSAGLERRTEDEPRLPPDPTLMYSSTCRPPQPPAGSGRRKLIVSVNRQFWWFPGDPQYRHAFQGCSQDACSVTDDTRLLEQADAVLVYVCLLPTYYPPPRASPRQLWVAFCLESPVHYSGFQDSPQWRGVFNWTMGYRTDSDVFYPYAFLSLRPGPSVKNFTDIVRRKSRPVAWLVSNCFTQGRREAYVKQLQNFIDVDVYGACSGRHCPKEGEGSCLSLLNDTYYFYLSFENSLCKDYVTEKLFKVYDNVDVVPVVRGGSDYARYFPPGTFLDAAHYASPRHLADQLHALMADPAAYVRLLEKKDRFRVVGDTDKGHNLCELCRRLHEPDLGSATHYPDFMGWTRNNACRQPVDV